MSDEPGDHANKAHAQWAHSIDVLAEELMIRTSETFTLTVYPSNNLNSFQTDNPRYATNGSVCTILLTSVFFLFYDKLVRRDLNIQRDLLEAKRQFVSIHHSVSCAVLTFTLIYNGLEIDAICLARGSNTSVSSRLQALSIFGCKHSSPHMYPSLSEIPC